MIAGAHALVTGGGTGVGRAIAEALASQGAAVTICGRRREPLDAVADGNPGIHVAIADVTDEISVEQLYREAEAARGPFSIVVANAGIAESAPAHKTTLEQWNRIIGVNLTGAFLTVRPAIGRHVEARRRAHCLRGVDRRARRRPVYRALCRVQARGRGVDAIPGGRAGEDRRHRQFRLPRLRRDRDAGTIGRQHHRQDRAQRRGRAGESRSGNPQGRFIQPDEVADAVVWLCGDGAKSVNGQAIALSGGNP